MNSSGRLSCSPGPMPTSHCNSKMDLVKNRCATLIPAEVKARRKKFKIAVVTFWNRKKVEEVILDLKEQVDKSLRLFQVSILSILNYR